MAEKIANQILEDLGGGLILRRSTPEDAEFIATFNGKLHADDEDVEEDEKDFLEHIALWTKDLLTTPHPTFHPDDFTLVEDTKTGKIVSTLNLIEQTWSYEGIEFGVGRPELVGTLEEYRRRGLVRKQFEVIHKWSAERGHKLQAITGIPWYYRQFGYEMTVDLNGARRSYLPNIPKLKEGQEEPFSIRPAEEKDLKFVEDLYNNNEKRYLLSCKRDQASWEYELKGRNLKSTPAFTINIIENPEKERVGYLIHPSEVWGSSLFIFRYEIVEGLSWLKVTPSVMRHLQKTGEAYVDQESKPGKEKKLEGFVFDLGTEHPMYHVYSDRMPNIDHPYAWYIRVVDVPDFLRLISPVLEERLARSYLVGHSGELSLNFYTDGVKMVFEDGKIKSIEPWEKPERAEASVNFPDLTFFHLLFGYWDYDEIAPHFADLYASDRKEGSRVLLRALFPKKTSNIFAIA